MFILVSTLCLKLPCFSDAYVIIYKTSLISQDPFGGELIISSIPFSEILRHGDGVYLRIEAVWHILSKIAALGRCGVFPVGLGLPSGTYSCARHSR